VDSHPYSRRELLKRAGAASAVLLTQQAVPQTSNDIEIRVTPVGKSTLRLTLLPSAMPVVIHDGSMARTDWGKPVVTWSVSAGNQQVKAHNFSVELRAVELQTNPLAINVSTTPAAEPGDPAAAGPGEPVQQFQIDVAGKTLSFNTGDHPLLGLGEGGPQFDRRGSADPMRSGQGGFQLRTHGGRVPVNWIISAGPALTWAIFLHNAQGVYNFSGPISKFQSTGALLPLDLFLVVAHDPATIMSEYAWLTGRPELPPLWSLGYQQSHRTLANRAEVVAEAKTFREKKLPCDTMIYLGTGFCPSGWNTNNGEWEWNRKVFPDPKAVIDELHAQHFKVALHAVIRASEMSGTVRDDLGKCPTGVVAESLPLCYWKMHQPVFATGVDGWWPDEGDPLNAVSRITRNRFYWEAPQLDRPNERPFALHRNAQAGMQRYGAFLWSGDVSSLWETLQTHIPVALNTGLSGIPYWGTDIGGFVPTKEFTAELYLRWFQFGAFCPLFRSHGRAWKLRLPWGWNTGDTGPTEISNYNGAALPDASQLHNPRVEEICRKYLELRYRLMPYLYSTVREGTRSGLPVMRALWLHYPDDPAAVLRGDQYLWGRDMLVAPVVEKGATSRRVYLPKGDWYDYWTGERHTGGVEIVRAVDLETTPLYVRAGTILPLDPVRQYTGEPTSDPMEVHVYPGADGAFLLYEDDGRSFNYRHDEWMGVEMFWNDRAHVLRLNLTDGSKMLAPAKRLVVRLGAVVREAVFEGRPMEVKF
jgi:alpha-glucosidase (family GH31 glycosyl hydrolase)